MVVSLCFNKALNFFYMKLKCYNFLELDVSAVHKESSETEEAPPTSHVRNTNIETAHQIQSLLTEIGSNNLVTSAGEGETTNINFHPCPWCSGRLITV